MKTNDRDLERLVIGNFVHLGDCSIEQAQKAFNLIKPGMFTFADHKIIFENLTKLIRANRLIELIELSSMCESDNTYQGGFAYLAELCRDNRGSANLYHYCLELRNRAQKRFALNQLNNAIMELSNDNDDKTNEIIAGIGSFADEFLSKRSNETGIKHISDIIPKFMEAVQLRHDEPEKLAGYTTGISQLDDVLAPKQLRKGTLLVVGARPKMGKTMLSSRLANHFAIELGKAVPVYSMEMLEDEVVERSIADDSGISSDIFYAGGEDHEWQQVGNSGSRLMNSNMYINDTAGISLAQIKAECRSIHKKHEVGLIVVDYLTLMAGEKAERNDLSYGLITKGLKALAKELKCVVMLLTQLNRGLESRSDKRPMPSDSRDTGQIEQDADYWVGIYRESVYSDNVPAQYKGYTEIELRLNRHGNTGKAFLNMKNGRFEEIPVEEYARLSMSLEQQKQDENVVNGGFNYAKKRGEK
jgi:replicative DNA helicase